MTNTPEQYPHLAHDADLTISKAIEYIEEGFTIEAVLTVLNAYKGDTSWKP